MPHNKGKTYSKCPVCNRKRYCTFRQIDSKYSEGTCSKDHRWTFKTGILTRIIAIEMDRMAERTKALFERDNLFLKQFRR